MNPHTNLLTCPVFRVQTPQGTEGASLPGLLALLGEDRVESLLGLQRHQEDAFHIFCCYLAGAVLARQGKTDPHQDAAFWLEGIRSLTRQEGCVDDSPWMLIVDDPVKPAFMQPPESNQKYTAKAMTPDALDALITSRNHDVKFSRAKNPYLDNWFFALICLNGIAGYGGRNTNGVARMNTGAGSRPRVSWLPNLRLGDQFTRDVALMIADRERLLQPPHVYSPIGKVLLWLPPGAGLQSYALKDLDPFFVEVARRIRLRSTADGIQIFSSGSNKFIAADAQKGNLGDPWIPISHKSNGALATQESGFTSELLRALIFGDGYTPAAMQRIDRSSANGYFSASVLVGDQCKTQGFHSALIPMTEKTRAAFFGGGLARDRLAMLSKRGIDVASKIQFMALRPAILSLMGHNPKTTHSGKKNKPKRPAAKNKQFDKWVVSAIKPFIRQWNTRYFDWLWATVDIANDDEAMRLWFDDLRQLAQDTLNHAFERVPQRRSACYRAKTKAQDVFFGVLREQFSHYMDVKHDKP